MPLFRRKPKVAEAVRFDPWGEHRLELPPGVEGCPGPGADNWGYSGCEFWVTTAQGVKVPITRGEWVIAERTGNGHYPCSAEEFAALYEPVESEAERPGLDYGWTRNRAKIREAVRKFSELPTEDADADTDESGYLLATPFWIDTEGYSDEARLFFCYGVEFANIMAHVRNDDGELSTTIHRENESRVRMLCGRFGRRCTIEACEPKDDPAGIYSYLAIEPK